MDIKDLQAKVLAFRDARYLFYGISDGPFGYDRNEVEAIALLDCEKLLAGEYDGEYDILPHVYVYTEELKGVWEELVK